MNQEFALIAERKSLSDKVFDAIFERIVTGQLRSGERLNEALIAMQMGISRAPVREAMQRLRQQGLVDSAPGKRPSVVKMPLNKVRELFRVRVTLEHAAVDEWHPESGEGLARDLMKNIQTVKGYGKSGQVLSMVNEEVRFHEFLVRASGNALLVEMYEILVARLRMVLVISLENAEVEKLVEVADCHNEIVASIKDGDFIRTKELLREDIWRSFPVVAQHPLFA